VMRPRRRCGWSCTGEEAGRPRSGARHAARSSSSMCLSVSCWLNAHASTSLMASSWTSARCAASGPRTRTISTELDSRRVAARDERATFSIPTGGACSSLATAMLLQATR
jgi:hypothetical protein